jgi:hypothetical protein
MYAWVRRMPTRATPNPLAAAAAPAADARSPMTTDKGGTFRECHGTTTVLADAPPVGAGIE